MAILAALFIHIGMSLYAGAVVFEQFFWGYRSFFHLIVLGDHSAYTIFVG